MIFLNMEKILEEHKSKRHPHMWIIHLQRKHNRPLGISACRPKRLIYLSICWCKALSLCLDLNCHLFYSSSPSFCLLSTFLRDLNHFCGWKLFLMSLICVFVTRPLDHLLSFRLSAACSPSVTTHPLTRKRSCEEKNALYIFLSGNVLLLSACVKMSVQEKGPHVCVLCF